MNDDILKLYKSLQKDGYGNLGTSDEFRERLKDENNRKKLYDSLTKDGYGNLGTFEEFSGRLTRPMADQTDAVRLDAPSMPETVETPAAKQDTIAPVLDQAIMPTIEQPVPVQEDVVTDFNDEPAVLGRLSAAQRELEDIERQLSEKGKAYANIPVAPGAPATFGPRMADKDYRRLQAAAENKRQEIRQLQHLQEGKTNNFWTNIGDVFADPNTWTFGLAGMDRSLISIDAADDDTRQSSQVLLGSMLNRQAAEADAEEERGFWGHAGRIAGQMVPFMVEIGMTGGLGNVAEAVEGKVAGMAGKYAEKKVVKALGTLAGDLASGVAMAGTIGAGHTVEGAINRKMGEIVEDEDGGLHMLDGYYKPDPDGNVVGDDGQRYTFIENPSWLTAGYKALMSQALEYSTERLGDHLQKGIGTAIAKRAAARGKKSLSPAVEAIVKNWDVDPTDFGLSAVSRDVSRGFGSRLAEKSVEYLNRLGIQGYPFEGIEEEANIIFNAALVGDNKFSDLWDKEQQADIWGGMFFSAGVMQAVPFAVSVGADAYNAGKARRYTKISTDMEKAADNASALIGERWSGLRDHIDSTENGSLADLETGIMDSDEYTQDEKSAICDYIHRLETYRGFNNVTAAQAREAIEQGPEGSSTDEIPGQMDAAYIGGYNAGDEQQNDIRNSFEFQKAALKEKTGLDSVSPDNVMELLQSENWSPEQKQAVLDYMMAAEAKDGMIQAVRDDISRKITTASTTIDRNTSKTDGMVHPAAMKDGRNVYIVDGTAVMTQDGTMVDHTKSQQDLLVRDAETGQLFFASVDQLQSVDEALDPIAEKQAVAEQLRQTIAQDAADRIDGILPFNPGDTYSLLTDEGHEVPVTVAMNEQGVVDNGDGTVNVVINNAGAEGSPVLTTMPKDQIQAMVDASRMATIQRYADELQAAREARERLFSEKRSDVDEGQGPPPPGAAGSPVMAKPEVQEAKVEEQPAIPVDAQGRKQYMQAPAEASYEDIYSDENFESDEEAYGFISGKVKRAEEALKANQSSAGEVKPEDFDSPAEYRAAKNRSLEAVRPFQEAYDYWKGVKDLADAEANAAKDRAARMESEEEKALAQPRTVEEVAANSLNEMGRRLDMEDFKKETGLTDAQAKKFFPFWAKDGKGVKVQELAETIAANDQTGLARDPQAVKDAIVAVMRSASRPADIYDYTRNANVARSAVQAQAPAVEKTNEESVKAELEKSGIKVVDDVASLDRGSVKPGEVYASIKIDKDGFVKVSFKRASVNSKGNTIIGTFSGPKFTSLVGEDLFGEEYDGEELGDLDLSSAQLLSLTIAPDGRMSAKVELRDKDGKSAGQWDTMVLKNNPLGQLGDQLTEAERAAIEKGGAQTAAAPVAQAVAEAEAQVNTAPTDGQKEAGNYRMGHVKVDGFDISIENPKGSVRRGTSPDGKAWETKMNNTYGYIRRTAGKDGDHIDVFLSDNPDQGNIFVVDQVDPKTGQFDEHKVMYGFGSAEEARAAYLSNYEKGWQGLGNITEVTRDEFKKWVDSSHRKTKPFAEYKSVKPVEQAPEESYAARKKAVLDQTQARLDELQARMDQTTDPAQTDALVQEKVQIIRDMLDGLGADKADVETRGTVAERYRNDGASDEAVGRLERFLRITKRLNERLRGFFGNGSVYIVADDIESAIDALTTYRHEDKHDENRRTGAPRESLKTGITRAEMVNAIYELTKSHDYDNEADVALADELIANAAEIAETDGIAAIPDEFRKAGIFNEDFITFVQKNIEDGTRRNGEGLHSGRGRSLQSVDSQVDGGQDVRDNGAGAGQVETVPGTPGGSRQETRSGEGQPERAAESGDLTPEQKQDIIDREGVSSIEQAALVDGSGIQLSIRTEADVERKIRDFAKTKEAKKLGWTPDTIEDIISETADLIRAIHAEITGNKYYDEWAQRNPTVKVDWRDGVEKPTVTWSRANIEYKYDMSADLLCINNEGLETVLASPTMVDLMLKMTETAKDEKEGFTSDDYLRLYETLRDMGFVVPCKGCFDAAMRLKMLPSVSRKFVDLVNKTIDERNADPEAFDESVRAMAGKKKTTVQGFPAATGNKADAVRVGVAGDKLTEHISWAQLMSAEGQTKALADWGGIFRAWQKTGAGRPKDKLLPEPWSGDIVSSTTTIIGKYGEKTPSYRDIQVNQGTGLRRNSHSEFRPLLAIDEIQFMREAFIRGLTVFKYMKELDDVRLFGQLGVKFNMSFFPAFVEGAPAAGLDANGDYIAAEESVGGREFEYVGEDGKTHYDGMKGWQEAQKYLNKDVSLSSVVFSIPHLIKTLTDVPTAKDPTGMWGSLIPFHASGATAGSLKKQGLGEARAIGVGHGFEEAMTDYDKGVTNFEAVQNDRFGEGWEILAGEKAGETVEPGHKLEFANGTHYYNKRLGLHLFSSFYIYDNELKPEHFDKNGNVDSKKAKKAGHPFVVDYNDKVREIGTDTAYQDAADFYIRTLREIGLVPRFDFEVPEETFLKMCADAKVDPNHPKLGWKGAGNSWSPVDSDAYYSLFCDYGMIDPETGKMAPHNPVGVIDENGNRVFRLPDNAIDIIREGVERYGARKSREEGRVLDAIEEFAKRTVAEGKLSQEDADTIIAQAREEAAESNAITDAEGGEESGFRPSIRSKEPPKNTDTGYKVFFLKNGKLYPPMVANPDGAATPVGVWLDADAAPVAGVSKTGRKKVQAGGKGTQGGSGQLSYRPGWHLGTIPYALQFNRGPKVDNPLGITNQKGEVIKVGEFFPKDFVWAEVEYAKDKDYQEEAMSYGYNENGNFEHAKAGLPRIPEDGSYLYRTNANPATDPWIITGAMRVKSILTPSKVDDLVRKAGREPQKRQEGAITDEQIKALNEQLGVAPNDSDIQFSIRGVVGAMNDEVAMHHLDVAKTLEKEGLDANTIWAATGWERGADGKWRNEIKDAKPKVIENGRRVYTVKEVIDAPELFEAYPEIRDYKVVFKKMDAAGDFEPAKKTINLDSEYNLLFELSKEQREQIDKSLMNEIRAGKILSNAAAVNYRRNQEKKVGTGRLDNEGMDTIMHELQHAIQEIEGFAKGGSSSGERTNAIKEAVEKDQNLGVFAHFFSRKNSVQRLLNAGREKIIGGINGAIPKFKGKDRQYLEDLKTYLSSCSEQDYVSLVKSAARLVSNNDAKTRYNNLAGEVEARNVERRRYLSDDQRKATPPSQTEDVPRDEQGVRFSVKADPETEKLFDAAKERFGTTRDLREAGYILPDGTLLDFSGRHWTNGGDNSWLNGMRQVDHRDIADIEFERDGNTRTGLKTDMSDFIRRGAIRIDMPGSINLYGKPTPQQRPWLQRLINSDRSFVRVDFGDGYHSDHYADYENASPSKILFDIDGYFDDGIKPEGNAPMFSIVNRNQDVFVSNAEASLDRIKMEKATPEQWVKMLEKEGGLKAAEDKWIGLSDWLKSQDKKSVTKQEIADYIAEHRIRIEEQSYSENVDTAEIANEEIRENVGQGKSLEELQAEVDELVASEEYRVIGDAERQDEWLREKMIERYGDDFDSGYFIDEENKIDYAVMPWDIDEVEIMRNYGGTRRINSTRLVYTTEGLDNKREIALTVPTIEPWNQGDNIHFGDAGEGRAVAWARFGETTDAEGNRVLVIDEIQSKRHQEGREKGYVYPGQRSKSIQRYEDLRKQRSEVVAAMESVSNKEEWDRLNAEFERINEEMGIAYREMRADRDNKRVKAAPFEKNWHELAMKRMLRLAAEEGYDYVAWTTGDQQAERYNIGGVVDRIVSGVDSRGKRHLVLYPKDSAFIAIEHDDNGDIVNVQGDNGAFSGAKNISDIIGKELAEQSLQVTEPGSSKEFSGDGLKYGGEGMRGFYDDILPRFMNKYGKKWGVKVSDITLPNVEEAGRTMHAVPVTQEMKESVMQGQPMFSVKGDLEKEIDAASVRDELSRSIGRELTEKEASSMMDFLDSSASRIPASVEYSKEEFGRLFGNGVDTPMGRVKMGENQFEKFGEKNRDHQMALAYETLTSPDTITEKPSRAKDGKETERPYSLVYIKTFKGDDGETITYYNSVSAKVDGLEVVVSNYEPKSRTRVKREYKEGKLAYIKEVTLPSESATSTQGDQNTVPGGANSSGNKGSDNFGNSKESAKKPMFSILGRPVEEIVNDGKMKIAEENDEARAKLNDRMRAIDENLAKLRMAAAAQREYDRETVRSVTDLAKRLLSEGALSDPTRQEIQKLLTVTRWATGRKDLTSAVDAIMNLMVGNQLRHARGVFEGLLKIRGSKVDARGVEVQGKLDIPGQRLLQVFKDAMDMSPEAIDELIAAAEARLDSADDTMKAAAGDELVGLRLAREYVDSIRDSIDEEKGITAALREAAEDRKEGKLSGAAYREYAESSAEAIRQNRIERINAYNSIAGRLGGRLYDSIARGKAFREEEAKRIERIHHFANSDLEGKKTDEHGEKNDRLANNGILRFLLKPLATFDQMLRYFGGKSVNGEGYLWNHFMRGWVDANDAEYKGMRAATDELDRKVSEVFGRKMRWSDLYSVERKMPTVEVKFWDGGKMKDHVLTQGNLLYIYMVNKMSDGRMKLRRMGIEEEHVQAIKEQMDPRFIELADWLQDEFLVNLRNKYNRVHEKLFGAPMAAIENYFPLKVLANARVREVDMSSPDTDGTTPSTITGSIIKRRRNSLALDVLGTDAFSLVIEHLEQMEHWAAFASFNQDLNTLLSYKTFRNKVQNMSSIYGAGSVIWENFRKSAEIAAGVYRPAVSKDSVDKTALNIAKGVTAAKISFRVYTAIKQLLSMPAFISDANVVQLVKSLATPWKSWNWAIEELPGFQKRWLSRQAGDTRLMKTDSDWKMWRNNIVTTAGRLGMSPNAFVDALTVSIGAKAMYETRKKKYLDDGYTEGQAEKRAKQDATILFNETQQSNEAAYLSAMQLDRTWASVALTVFRNSSMGYQRQLVDAVRNIGRKFQPGYKETAVEFMTKQMVRDGIDEEDARDAAERNYSRSTFRDALRVAVFGFVMQFAWNLGKYLPYLLAGGDDDEKKKMLKDAARQGLIGGTVEGLTGGSVISEAANMLASGESLKNYDPTLMPVTSDIQRIIKMASYDQVAAANEVVNLLVQSGIGVNPQTITDIGVAIYDACHGDPKTTKEATLLLMRILQCPQSQVDKVYIDELDLTAEKGLDLSISEFAKRYADYKVRRGAATLGWMYSDENREKRVDSYEKKFTKQAKDLIRTRGNDVDRAYYEYVDTEHKEVEATLRELRSATRNASESGDQMGAMEYAQAMNDFMQTPEYQRYARLHGNVNAIKRLQTALKKADDRSRDAVEDQILQLKRQMVDELNRTDNK